jgi:hypothetical protein
MFSQLSAFWSSAHNPNHSQLLLSASVIFGRFHYEMSSNLSFTLEFWLPLASVRDLEIKTLENPFV